MKKNEYQKGFTEILGDLNKAETLQGSEKAVLHANQLMNELLGCEDFKDNGYLQGKYDACEQFLQDHNALAG